jgi:Protein of unknown function (DUF1064)
MRRETKQERAAWSAYFGDEVKEPSKYGNEKTGKYASKHEAEVAANLTALERAGKITNLQEQVGFTLVEGNGKIRPIRYVADFVWKSPDGEKHVGDAKGFSKNRVWIMKKKMMKLLLGLEVEEL